MKWNDNPGNSSLVVETALDDERILNHGYSYCGLCQGDLPPGDDPDSSNLYRNDPFRNVTGVRSNEGWQKIEIREGKYDIIYQS